MSRGFLQTTLLSLIGTQGRNTSVPHYFSTYSTLTFRNLRRYPSYYKKMPVIPAVIAHHRHHLCQHQHALHAQYAGETGYNNSCARQQLDYGQRCWTSSSNSTFFQNRHGLSVAGMLGFSSDSKQSLLICEAESRRYYSKGKDKVKSNKRAVIINEEEMSEVIDVQGLKGQLEAIIVHMRDDYTKQLSIRGAAGALETLEVEYEGEVYPLQELAQVGRKNPQLAVLNLSSLPDACPNVMKAILDCGMNLNPQQEGTTIYVPLPKVTREHRENLAKAAKVIFTKYKASLQGVQNRYIKQCKSQKDISEDLTFSVQQQIMKLTETYITEAERLTHAKQKELLDSN